MLVIFPVSAVDQDLAVLLSHWIHELGGGYGHTASVVFDDQVDQERRDAILQRLSLSFQVLDCEVIRAGTGWPQAPGVMFRHASFLADARKMPWFFMEPDCLPTREGWLHELASEYDACGKPFMGCIERHWQRIEPTGELLPDGEYLMGAAVYPPNLRAYTRTHLFPCEVPFDVGMRHDLFQRQRTLVHRTDLMQNCWRTRNYRMTPDGPVGEAMPSPNGHFGESLTRKVDLKAAVIHGAKDSSLMENVRNLRSQRSAVLSGADAQAAVAN